jgi:predicted MPP superfamily phosphohydrolase
MPTPKRQPRKPVSRLRKWTRRAFIGVALAGLATPVIGLWCAKRPRVERVEVWLPRLPAEADGLRVAALSDTHVGRWRDGRSVTHAVEMANAEEPDLALLLGDYCHRLAGGTQASFDEAIHPFAGLTAPLGIFAIMGNHDYWDGEEEVQRAFETAGVPLLVNEHRRVPIRTGHLAVVGLDDLWVGGTSVGDAYEGLPSHVPRLTLSHNPDRFIENDDADLGLMLSGHTHGGQICIPGFGPIRVPIQHTQYAMGLHERGGHLLYTSRGVGTITPPIRLFCPAEVSIITLRAGWREVAQA